VKIALCNFKMHNSCRMPYKLRYHCSNRNDEVYNFQQNNKVRIKFEQVKYCKSKTKTRAECIYHPLECKICQRRVGQYYISVTIKK
jgi:hypothetical protein